MYFTELESGTEVSSFGQVQWTGIMQIVWAVGDSAGRCIQEVDIAGLCSKGSSYDLHSSELFRYSKREAGKKNTFSP